jgi:hypothetical protein
MYDNTPACKFGLRENEFLRHMGLFGITGTGKSNSVFKIIDELMNKNKKVLVFDWKKQYRDYLSIKPDADVLIFGVGNENIPCFQFNPLIPPPGIDPHQYLEHVCSIVASSYYCGEGVISLLRKAISELYDEFGVSSGTAKTYPTFKEVLIYVNNIERKGRSRDWQESTVRSVEAICHGGLGQIVNVQRPTLQLSELLNHNVFLELGDLGQSQKSFIIQSLLTYLYYFAMNRGVREKLLNVIVVEEAHHILRDHSHTTVKEPITDIILKEIREFSTGIIIIDQNPSLISVPALANNYCTIGMYTKHGSDINALSKAMFLSEDQKEYLGKLECGFGIVKLAGRIFTPFLVSFPLMKIKKGSISDKEVESHMQRRGYYSKISGYYGLKQNNSIENEKGIISDGIASDDEYPSAERFDSYSADSGARQGYSTKQSILSGYSKKDSKENIDCNNLKTDDITARANNDNLPTTFVSENISYDKFNDRKAILLERLIVDIRSRPFDGIASRTKRLNISPRKCNDIINELEHAGLISKVDIVEKSGRKILLELKKGTAEFQKDGGIEHRYWNNRIAEINNQKGFQVEIEKKIEGDGYIDQVMSLGNKSIAIEIETGKSHPIETIKRDIELGFSKVICVATNNKAYEIIRDKLLKENLIDNPKVSFYLAANYK